MITNQQELINLRRQLISTKVMVDRTLVMVEDALGLPTNKREIKTRDSYKSIRRLTQKDD